MTAADSSFSNGVVCGIGPLPHRDASAAAAFSIGEFEISTIPSLPAVRSLGDALTESLVEALGRHGDPESIDVSEPIGADARAGRDAFLDLARAVRLDGTPVAWQFPGPMSLGLAVHRAGVDVAIAFELASRAVRTQIVEFSDAVSAAMPMSPQLVMLDEPALAHLMDPAFPIPPDQAIDLISGGMAALPSTSIVGIHCDQPCDIATLLAAGPAVMSVPVEAGLVEWAGYINRFLEGGGVVAWGAMPTDGPLSMMSERHWRAVSDLWCELVRRGCDPVALRRQSMITPAGGLDAFSVSVARRIVRVTTEVAKRVKDQANATRFALGA